MLVANTEEKNAGRFDPTELGKQPREMLVNPEDVWHLDEIVSIGGRKHWLWRAVDQEGYVLDEIVQARSDTKAAKQFLVDC